MELQPPPYICPIYRRDIACFLPREKVDQWRLLSRLSNRALSEFPSELPRRVYHHLSIHMYDGPCRRKDDGFVTGAEDIPGRAFNSIYKFRLCCKELKQASSCLVGQRIFPNKPDEEVIAFVLCTRIGEVALRVVNRLTEKTAHGLVHFLRHIKGCRIEWICFDFDTELNSEEDGKMSPELLKVLSTVHTRKKFLLYTEETHTMDVPTLKIARQLVHYRTFSAYFWDLLDNAEHVFAFLASARPVVQVAKIELREWMDFEVGFVDTLVNYFARTARALGEAIPEVTFFCSLVGWPRSCPKRLASATDREHYTFHYKNVHTEEEFEMTLKTRRRIADGQEKVIQVQFKFD